jgi:hypothetical protein
MDFEEFEKEQEEKQKQKSDTTTRYGCGASGSCGPDRQLSPAHTGYEDWEDYMQFGMGSPRNFHGF